MSAMTAYSLVRCRYNTYLDEPSEGEAEITTITVTDLPDDELRRLRDAADAEIRARARARR